MLLLQAILDDRSRLLLTGGGGRLGVAWMQRLTILGLWLESTDQLLSLLATRLVSFLLGVPRRRTGTDTAEGVKRSALAAAVVAAGGRHCFDVNFGGRKDLRTVYIWTWLYLCPGTHELGLCAFGT